MDQSNCWNCRTTALAVRSTCILCVCNWTRPSLTTSHKQDAHSPSSLQLLSPVANGGLGQESLPPTTGTTRICTRTHTRTHTHTHTQYMQNDVPPYRYCKLLMDCRCMNLEVINEVTISVNPIPLSYIITHTMYHIKLHKHSSTINFSALRIVSNLCSFYSTK